MKLSQNRLKDLHIQNQIPYIENYSIKCVINGTLYGQQVDCLDCKSYTYYLQNDQMRWQKKRLLASACPCNELRNKFNYHKCSHCNLNYFSMKAAICPCCKLESCRDCQQPIQLFTSTYLQCDCYKESTLAAKLKFFLAAIVYSIMYIFITLFEQRQIFRYLLSNCKLPLILRIITAPIYILVGVVMATYLFPLLYFRGLLLQIRQTYRQTFN